MSMLHKRAKSSSDVFECRGATVVAQGPFGEERDDKCGHVSYHEHNIHEQMHVTPHIV